MTASPFAFASSRPTANSSTTKKPPATEVFLVRAMKTLISGGIVMRNACGSTTRLTVWPKPSPTLRAASACPTGTPLMPDRSASATNGDV